MVKKKADRSVWPWAAAAASLAIVAIGGAFAYRYLGQDEGTDIATTGTCLPQAVSNVLANTVEAKRSPGNVQLYLDASGGMAGYVAGSPNAIGNLITLSRTFVQGGRYPRGREGEVHFFKFGEYRFNAEDPVAPEEVADADSFARPGAFTDSDTNIADLLDWISHSRNSVSDPAGRPLSVIVTDLMLDDREAVDEFEASVGGRLRTMMIEQGLAVGIMSVRVPFSGNIFVDGKTIPASVSDRPLVMLLIGDPFQVRSFYDELDTSEIEPFSAATPLSHRGFSVFGLEASSIILSEPEMSGLSSGFVPRTLRPAIPGAEGIASFAFDADEGESATEGGIVVTLQANAGVENFEVVGNEPLWETAVWKLDPEALDPQSCASGQAWLRVGSLPSSGWKRSGQSLTYTITADAMEQAGMLPEGTYLVQLLAGQRGIVADHPAAAWMSEWSMSNADLTARLTQSRGATRIGVPGLDPLRRILLTELMLPGREEIERSAAQLIIQNQ